MGLSIANCVVSNSGQTILDNPTKAEVFDQMTPSENITITGGTRHVALVQNKAYKITGRVGDNDRTFMNMKCSDTGNPAKFKKSATTAEHEE